MTIANLSPDLSLLLLGILFVELTIGALLWRWASNTPTPTAESPPNLTYLVAILALLLVLIITVTTGSILAQMDRPFYAAGGVSTSEWILTPAHYIMFLTCYPIYFITGAIFYHLIKKNDPAALPQMKWVIIAATVMPLMFIPAVNGDLLDKKVTTWETIYLGFYQAANVAWIILGLVPLGLYATRRIMASLGTGTQEG